MIHLDDVQYHPDNKRKGDVKKIKRLIKENGFLSPIVVQESTDYIVVGNHRVQAARDLGYGEVPGYIVDIDDDAAQTFLIGDNVGSDAAEWDEEGLAEILQGLLEAGSIKGTGYSKEEAEDIVAPWQDAKVVQEVKAKKKKKNKVQELEEKEELTEEEIDELIDGYIANDDEDKVEKAVEKKPKKKEKSEEAKLSTRPIVFTIPSKKFKIIAEAFSDGKEKAKVRTNEELVVFMLKKAKLLDKDFVLYEE